MESIERAKAFLESLKDDLLFNDVGLYGNGEVWHARDLLAAYLKDAIKETEAEYAKQNKDRETLECIFEKIAGFKEEGPLKNLAKQLIHTLLLNGFTAQTRVSTNSN